MNLINENEQVKYKIILEGKTLAERDSKILAEMFINGLPDNIKEKAQIVPSDSHGKQILLG